MENSDTAPKPRCLNCGTELYQGKFCHVCGQPVDTRRLSTLNMGVTILSGITRINSRFVYTLKNILLRPWKVISEYIRGRRATYVAPVQLLLVLLFIVVALPSLFGLESSSLAAINGNRELLYGSGPVVTAVNYIFKHIISSETLLFVMLLVPAIPIVKLVHRFMGIRRYNIAEYIVASLYMSCFIVSLSLVFMLPSRLIGHYFSGASVFLPVIQFFVFLGFLSVALYKSFASSGKKAATKVFYIFLCIVLCFFFYLFLLMVLMVIHEISFGRF